MNEGVTDSEDKHSETSNEALRSSGTLGGVYADSSPPTVRYSCRCHL